MIGTFMLYTIVITIFIGGAAAAAEYIARSLGRPTRWVWVAAIALVLAASAAAYGRATTPAAASSPQGMSVVHSGAPSGRAEVVQGFETVDGTTATPPWLVLRRLFGQIEMRAAQAYDVVVGPIDSWLVPLRGILTAGWIIASLLAATYLVVGLLRVRRIMQSFETAMVNGVPVLVSHDVGPALVGIMAPRIVVPRWVLELGHDERRAIITHEQEHAEARDPALLLFTLIALLLEPWNAALWLIIARTRFAAEADCDARVLRRLGDAREYGRLLLAVYERSTGGFLPRAALVERRSNLERRVRRMAQRAPRAFSLGGALAIAGVAFCVTIAWSTPLASGPLVDTIRAPLSMTGARAPRGFLPTCSPGGRNPVPDLDQVQGWAREFYPAIMRDSTNPQKMVIGFVLDSTCAVIRHAAITYPAGPAGADNLFDGLFPDVHAPRWMMGIATGAQLPNTSGPGHDRVTITYALLWSPPAESGNQFANCGIDATTCSFDGQVLIHRVDSMHVVIAVRSAAAVSDREATGQTFLVTSLAPFSPLLSRLLDRGHVEYHGRWVYISDPQRNDPAIMIGEPQPEFAARPAFTGAVHFGALRGIAHYWGSTQLTFDQIRRLQPTDACHEPGECFVVDGKTWRFP